LGIYLLNISVDTADPNPEHISEDLSINDQESIVEIIVEQVLGYKNAIKEYDDHDTKEHNNKKNFKIDLLFHQYLTNTNACQYLSQKKQSFPELESNLINAFLEIDSPPPKI